MLLVCWARLAAIFSYTPSFSLSESTNGGGPLATQDYLDRAMVAIRGSAKALDKMMPLLPVPKGQ